VRPQVAAVPYDWIRGRTVHHLLNEEVLRRVDAGTQGACGISEQPDGSYLFIVAAYATDLLNAMAKLAVELVPAA
jgi:hypothetical protein